MSQMAEDRDAVERHLARSFPALAVTTGTSFSKNGQRGPQDGTGGSDGQPGPAGAQGPGTAADLDAPVRAGSALTGGQCLELFDAQLGSRHLDLAARWLRAQGAGFYTIGSSGHEGNAAVAAALRPGDPALLHYRSGAFYLARAGQAMPPRDGIGDVLLGLAAAAEEPIAGGRHKVLGHADLDIIPATSTIASHLPRALGLAFRLDRAARLGAPRRAGWPRPRRAGRASATSTPTAPTSPTCSTPPSPRRSGSRSGAPPRSCTCRWCASAGTRVPTRRPPTASPARSRPAWRATR